MFKSLREGRSLLMGLAMLGIVFYHAPFILHSTLFSVCHSMLNCGVDLFLFYSGLGACHSIPRRGGKGYLRQRFWRLMPGLYPVLILWCIAMTALGAMNLRQLVGSVTLLGWWLGERIQLNWYFSAVWAFFLLAVPLSRLFRKTKHPVLLWLGLTVLSIGLCLLCPRRHLLTALCRLPIFLTGMLFGTLEQRGFAHEKRLKVLCYVLVPVGLLLSYHTYWWLGYQNHLGYRIGLWWYPFGLFTPGLAMLISWVYSRIGGLRRFFRPLELCGESSGEILMLHIAIYKLIFTVTRFRNRYWVLIALGSMVLGCLYHFGVTRRLVPKHT